MVSGVFKGISDYDMHIILENLLDNAIEAALKTDDKRIGVDIYSDEQAIVIKISNSAEENVLKNNPEMNTTKKIIVITGMALRMYVNLLRRIMEQ